MVGVGRYEFAAVGAVAKVRGHPEAELVGEEASEFWEEGWVLNDVVELLVESCVGEEGTAGQGQGAAVEDGEVVEDVVEERGGETEE